MSARWVPVLAALSACAPPAPLDYGDDALWLCGGAGEDACRDADLDVAVWSADGTQQIVPYAPAEAPDAACFYVYPTVAMGVFAGNASPFAHRDAAAERARAQAARFGAVCDVYAPLYRQATLGSYVGDHAPAFERAYDDVEAAFDAFLARVGDDRPYVLIGHSQGTGMLTWLLQRRIEPDPSLLARLASAVLPGGGVEVPIGEVVGGSFTEVPLCTAPETPGCALAWRTFRADDPPTGAWLSASGPGLDLACTNPAALRGADRLTEAIFPARSPLLTMTVPAEAPFLGVPALYQPSCEVDDDGTSYLEVRPDPDDPRWHPAFVNGQIAGAGFGDHVLDVDYALGDLLPLVAGQIAAR